MSYSRKPAQPPMSKNLLAFLLTDPNPPIDPSRFWTDWSWYIRPMLLAYQQEGKRSTSNDTTTLPPLFPGSLFATHRLQTRRLRNEDDWSVANDEKRVTKLSFGTNTVAASDGTATNDPNTASWITKICTLLDPLEFPLESVVYASQQIVTDALQTIADNERALETFRRDQTNANRLLFAELKSLHSALFTLQQLKTNLNRKLILTKVN